jgi:predicted PurR-regulated permease PerM
MVSQQFITAAVLSGSAMLVSAAPTPESEELVLRSGNVFLNGIQGSVQNFQQKVDELSQEVQRNPGRAGSATVTAFIQGLDSQIDNAISTVSAALSPLTGGLSEAVGQAILGPFFQSVTDGAEVLIGNVLGGAVDLVASPIVATFSLTLSNLVNQGAQYNIDTSRLESLNNQLNAKIDEAKAPENYEVELVSRQVTILQGLQGSIQNIQQKVDELGQEVQQNPGRIGSATVTAVIQGLDSQIDNAISTVAGVLSPLTGGLSEVVGHAILGPFFQSVTDGAEVLIGNVLGGAVDLVASPIVATFSQTLSNLINQGNQYNIDTSRLQALNNQLTQAIHNNNA